MTAGEKHAALMAARVLLRRQIKTLPVDPLALLRACPDTRVYTLEAAADAVGFPPADLLRDADAVTLRVSMGEKLHYTVIYRVDGNPARLRFTLAHELGHRLLGHTGGDAAEEREADTFASHLLCPEPVVQRLRSISADDIDAADRIAVTCYVSRSCARVTICRPDPDLPHDIAAALDDLLIPVLTE